MWGTNMQRGQAIVEALVVVIALASVLIAIRWLGDLQDIGLQLADASRDQAFKYAYQDNPDYKNYGLTAKPWLMRDGSALVQNIYAGKQDRGFGSSLALYQNKILPVFAELNFGDDYITVHSLTASTGINPDPDGLSDFDRRYLQLNQHTAILAGTGAAIADSYVQDNLASSKYLWRTNADLSITAGQAATARLEKIDSAWGRSLPRWDWISPWTSWVPAKHLRSWRPNDN